MPRLGYGRGGRASGVISHGGLNPRVDETVLLKMAGKEVEVGDTCAVFGRDQLDPEVSDERSGAEDPPEFVNPFLCHQCLPLLGLTVRIQRTPADLRVRWNELLGHLPFEERLEIIARNLCVSENLGQKSWSDSFTGVHWNCGRLAIWMPKEMMTAFGPGDF